MKQRCSRLPQDLFVTDHRAVISTLNIKKLKPVTKRILVRQVNKIKLDQWMEEFKLDNYQT